MSARAYLFEFGCWIDVYVLRVFESGVARVVVAGEFISEVPVWRLR